MDYFISQGWTKEQAAGIVASLHTETGGTFNPQAKGDAGKAFGVGQWHPDRQANFQKVFGFPIQQSTYEQQLAFVQWELTNTEKAAGNRLRQQTTAMGAGGAVSQFYERPRDVAGNMRLRGNLAGQIAGGYMPGGTVGGIAGPVPGGGNLTQGADPRDKMSNIVDQALGMAGMNVKSSSALRSMIKQGAGLDPAYVAWCAAFVNTMLRSSGEKGARSNIATDFMRWGVPVSPEQMMKGDVGVVTHGHGIGQTGGHAVFMTGQRMMQHGRLMVETIGREGDRVMRRWRHIEDLHFRRAGDRASVDNSQTTVNFHQISDAEGVRRNLYNSDTKFAMRNKRAYMT